MVGTVSNAATKASGDCTLTVVEEEGVEEAAQQRCWHDGELAKTGVRRGVAQAEDVGMLLGLTDRGNLESQETRLPSWKIAVRDALGSPDWLQKVVEDQFGRPRALSVPECSPRAVGDKSGWISPAGRVH